MALAVTNGGQNLVSASENGSVWDWDVERKEAARVPGVEMESISELFVAKGFGFGDCNIEVNGWSLEFSSRDVSTPVRVMKMEKVLGGVYWNRIGAIDTLGSAIEAHAKLLEFILKEAKMGSNCDSSEQEEDVIPKNNLPNFSTCSFTH